MSNSRYFIGKRAGATRKSSIFGLKCAISIFRIAKLGFVDAQEGFSCSQEWHSRAQEDSSCAQEEHSCIRECRSCARERRSCARECHSCAREWLSCAQECHSCEQECRSCAQKLLGKSLKAPKGRNVIACGNATGHSCRFIRQALKGRNHMSPLQGFNE
jgi:hypothetical protein